MKWISVKEKTPPRGQDILVTDGEIITCTNLEDWEKGKLTLMGCVGFSGYEWEYDFEYKDITHWAELPKPPKGIE